LWWIAQKMPNVVRDINEINRPISLLDVNFRSEIYDIPISSNLNTNQEVRRLL
jgi:hypothetical protein